MPHLHLLRERLSELILVQAPVIEDGYSVTNLILGAKFQYKATSLIRLEAAADFGLRDKGYRLFQHDG